MLCLAMTSEKPARPKTFSELIANPKRDYADGVLATVLYELELRHGIDPFVLGELLFGYALLEIEPDADPVTKQAAVRWLCRLHSFRDRIDKVLADIGDCYKDKTDHNDPDRN
jgi:hypothetical protein